MNTVSLTKKLISIPSFVDNENNEYQIGEFIYQYLANLSWLKVEKQYVEKDRFNVFAFDNFETQILFTGHMDTVQTQSNWDTNPFEGIEKQGRIYGLGASDMKGSLACILTSIKNSGPTKGCAYLFYIDEEYDFKGTKAFIKKYKNKIRPKFIVSGDGSNLKFGVNCRGLIEITFKIKGQSGHAADPKSGSNAILSSMKAILALKKQIKGSSLNIAFINGGLKQNSSEIGKQGNMIADYSEFTVDIRPVTSDINSKYIIEIVRQNIEKLGCAIIQSFVRHDLGAWNTNREKIKRFTDLYPNAKFVDGKNRGFIDIQMLWENFSKVPCFTFGPGESSMGHKPNEYISINSLKTVNDFFFKLISLYN